MGAGDHIVSVEQAKICCERVSNPDDVIIVQEKLDGSCCAVALHGDRLYSLGRAGWPAESSRHEQHRVFSYWVRQNEDRFRALLREGERIIGEWLTQAHGTRYVLKHEPFVAFDIMIGQRRLNYAEFTARVNDFFTTPNVVSIGPPISVSQAMKQAGELGAHGAIDPIEGVVYRVERNDVVDFLAKYVRPDKIDGCFLPEISGRPAVWNWTAWKPKSGSS
jgi:hypothetical protein